MKAQEKPPSKLNLQCKKIVLIPCLKALLLTALIQSLFLGFFIALVNFNLFHPVTWILKLFGFHWLKHVPLLGILFTIGFILSKSFLHERKYYANRFKWLMDNGINKIALLSTEILFGLLTAWSFMSYLNISFFSSHNDITTINSRYTFLTFIGIAAGCYYFVRHHLKDEIVLHFEIIPKPKLMRLRESLQECLWLSGRNAIIPTISFSLFYWFMGSMINRRLAFLFNIDNVDNSLDSIFNIFTNIKLLFWAWLIIVEIFTIMSLMQCAFSIFLTEQYLFPVGSNQISDINQNVTLVNALSLNDFPILQNLAAQDFYNITKTQYSDRRKEIFKLSQPGGHPYNWTQLSGQCLSIINAFIDELNNSLNCFPGTIQTTSSSLMNNHNGMLESGKDIAQRVLIQQYNEKHNIRRLRSEIHPIDEDNGQMISTVTRINENFNRTIEEIIQRLVKTFKSLPGIFYLFGEPEGSKLNYLLSNCDLFIWITQGIAYICAASLIEDPYGVVQITLPEIMKTLLKLKAELDRLSTINLNNKKLNPNLVSLRNSLKRSLHKICNAFADYLPEIANDPNDLPYLRTFLYKSSRS